MKSTDNQATNGKKRNGCLPILVVVLVLAAIGSTLGNGSEESAASSLSAHSAVVASSVENALLVACQEVSSPRPGTAVMLNTG